MATTTIPETRNPPPPVADGEINEYRNESALKSLYFNPSRKVIFVNGAKTSGQGHLESAMALSQLQMCAVIGVYNQTSGFIADVGQCIADKNQFNGFSRSAQGGVDHRAKAGSTPEKAARDLLERNPAALALFDLLRKPENRPWEIFAHSQGNLILSNALQAIAAVDKGGLTGRVVHTFGSPSAFWPPGIIKQEYGFTWDPVSWLAGFDLSFSISKVGMPAKSLQPITHSFIEYVARDPAFVVNRYRWGGLGATFNMDEEGLAASLVSFGPNVERLKKIFKHLRRHHNSDADDVAVRYVQLAEKTPGLLARIKTDQELVKLLIRVMDEGWTSTEETKAIALLKAP